MATISALPLQLAASPASVANSIGLGTIFGQVNSFETPITGLAGIALELRDAQSYVLLTTTSNANGSFSFFNIPSGNYSVSPITELRETAIPTKNNLVIVSTGGTVTGGTFQIRGVPAFVVVTSTISGTYVAVYLSGTTVGTVPPVLKPSISLPIYSAVIPGGPSGGIFSSRPCWPA